MVHLRIADELLKHIDNIDETAFIMGNIAPNSGVPNEDWSEFHPPKTVSHFKTRAGDDAFSLYENAVNFDNEFMDIFSKDAFENRRRYICDFYRSDHHGNLHREYTFLTPEQADSFVLTTTERILEAESRYLNRRWK